MLNVMWCISQSAGSDVLLLCSEITAESYQFDAVEMTFKTLICGYFGHKCNFFASVEIRDYCLLKAVELAFKSLHLFLGYFGH